MSFFQGPRVNCELLVCFCLFRSQFNFLLSKAIMNDDTSSVFLHTGKTKNDVRKRRLIINKKHSEFSRDVSMNASVTMTFIYLRVEGRSD